VFESIKPAVSRHPQYIKHGILERMVEPERTIIFRVPCVEDQRKMRLNRGFRIKMNSAIGPYNAA
jgi:glutamate dehydrogenase (NADP+)